MNTGNTVPLTREAVERSKQDVSSSVQDTLVKKLIEDTNQGISDAVIRNLSSYTIHVPVVVFGFPAFNPTDVAKKLGEVYTRSGFVVKCYGSVVDVSW